MRSPLHLCLESASLCVSLKHGAASKQPAGGVGGADRPQSVPFTSSRPQTHLQIDLKRVFQRRKCSLGKLLCNCKSFGNAPISLPASGICTSRRGDYSNRTGKKCADIMSPRSESRPVFRNRCGQTLQPVWPKRVLKFVRRPEQQQMNSESTRNTSEPPRTTHNHLEPSTSTPEPLGTTPEPLYNHP